MFGIRRDFAVLIGFASATLALAAAVPVAAEPLKIRAGWTNVPTSLMPIFNPQEGVARHYGKSYKLDAQRYASSAVQITGLAAGEIDIAEQGFSTLSHSINNAGLEDIRIVADIIQDGVEGYATGAFMVLKDSPIKTAADLRGKVVATTGIGTGASIQIRAFLRKHGLTEKDYTEIETTYPGMKPMLVERKIDLGNFILPFLRQPDLNAVARPLFLQNEPFGPTEVLFIVSRAGFLQKNRPAMVDFLEDYVRVLRWYQDPANQERAVEIVAQYTKLPVNMLAGWLFTKQDYYRDPYGLVNLESLQKTMDAQKELGFIKTSPDVRQYADLSLVKEAAQGLK